MHARTVTLTRITGVALFTLAATTCTTGDGDMTTLGGTSSATTGSTGSTSGGGTCDTNGMVDGLETDVDCGGPDCPACDNGQACELNGDCMSLACMGSTCVPPSCMDGAHNQDETDFDCGGSCPPCTGGQGCEVGSDCDTMMCDGGTCTQPTCSDGLKNGNESDVDCGGVDCDGCADGGTCTLDGDCTSGYCADGTCAAKACEADSDCADLTGPCAEGFCDTTDYTCQANPINEGMTCDDMNPCTSATSCVSGSCTDGMVMDCSALDDQCLVGTCNEMTGECEALPGNEGDPCDDGDACTASEVCAVGVCEDADGPDVHLDEDFSDDMGGWTLGNNWEIGPAMTSGSGDVGGPDPGTDHTDTADEGLAGVLIGGVTSGSVQWTYLESPQMDLSMAPGDLTLSLWRWLNADANGSMPCVIEVYDGNGWVELWANPDSVTADTMWTEQTFDVTAHKNGQFQVRVGYRATGAAGSAAGWNVDDVLLAPPGCGG